MQYTVIVTIPNLFTVEAKTEEEAIQKVKMKLHPAEANAASYIVAEEAVWNAADQCYYAPTHNFNEEAEENECNSETNNISDERAD